MSETPRCIICDSVADIFSEKSGYTLYTCRTCALTFVYSVPHAASVYGEDYFSGASGGFGYVDYDADKEPMVQTFEEYLRRIALVTKGKRILDVGTATGFFLQIAKRFGFNVHGVELSPYAAQRAIEKGIPMTIGTLSKVPTSLKFDVITMLDVIEHVYNPALELVYANALLEKDGVLVINTPDIGSLFARLMGARWHLIVPPEHLFYFNRSNMRRLLEQKGFEVLSMSTIGKQFTLQYIFQTLHRWQGLSLWHFLADFCERRTWLKRLALPINLGDNMFVMARKL